jgi:anti-sigma B factor antagonist
MAQPANSFELKGKLRFHAESVYSPRQWRDPPYTLESSRALAPRRGAAKTMTSPKTSQKGLIMNLHIEQRESEGIVILDLKGPLTLGHGDLELRDRLPALRQSGNVNIILNLKEVSEIDSTGLGTLVFGLARLRKAGGRLALVNLNRSHLELFLLTKLAIAFEFFEDEQDAVNSFFPDRALKRFDILNFVQQKNDRNSDRGLPSPAAC